MIVNSRPASLALWLLLSTSTACATFTDHNENVEEAYQAFTRGRFDAAAKALEEGKGNKLDGLCYNFDSAVVRQVQGSWNQSITDLQRAKTIMGGFDDRAKISASEIAETSASFLVNEKTIPYKGEDYERVLLPLFQARNYFMSGDYEGAAVEARRVHYQQDLVRKKYEAELENARKEQQKQKAKVGNADTSNYFSTIQKKCKVPPKYLNSTQSVYQMAIADYLTGVVLEADESYDDASFFYRKAVDTIPQSRAVQQALIMNYVRANEADKAKEAADKYGLKVPDARSGTVVVFYDNGEGPIKLEVGVVFPTGGFGFQKFSLPFFAVMDNPCGSLEVQIGSQKTSTDVLTSVEQVAYRYFNDRMPLIVAKAIIRVLAKIAAQKTAELAAAKNGNLLARAATGLGASLILSLTEQADLRSWRTLPQNFQVARFDLPEGTHTVRIKLRGRSGGTLNSKDIGTITVKAGQVGILNVRSIRRDFWGAASPNLSLGKGQAKAGPGGAGGAGGPKGSYEEDITPGLNGQPKGS